MKRSLSISITIFLLLFFCCSVSHAELTKADNHTPFKQSQHETKLKNMPADNMNQNFLPQIVQITLSLFFVIFIIVLGAWLTRRFGQFQTAGQGHLKIVGGLHLGTRERLVLVQVGEQQILIGVGAGRIETLLTLDKPILIENNSDKTHSSFSVKLAQLMRRDKD